MIRVLFVDDEPAVLQGIRRMLHPERAVIEARTAESGPAALELLAQQEFDVVVSDMRMPGMDGAELLGRVAEAYPGAVRIVLSGYAEQGAALRAAGSAHQYLAKPCEPASLVSALRRTARFRDFIASERLRVIVTTLPSLPSLPELYVQIVGELNAPDSSTDRIGAVIGRDVAMTAKILQLVNSAFFGLPRKVATPAEAVRMLGVRTIQALVLSTHVFSQFEGPKEGAALLRSLWEHSLRVGEYTAAICASADTAREARAVALIAGMLHDVGRVILAHNFPERSVEVSRVARETVSRLLDVERDAFGATHCEVGACLLGLWAIPEAVVEAIAFHHEPALAEPREPFPLVAVHVSNYLAHIVDGGMASAGLDTATVERFGGESLVAEWAAVCGVSLGEAGDPT